MTLRSREVTAAVLTAVCSALVVGGAHFLPVFVRPTVETAGLFSLVRSLASTATVLAALVVAWAVADADTDIVALGGAFAVAGAVCFGLAVSAFVLAPIDQVTVPAPLLVAASTVINATVPFAVAAVAGGALRSRGRERDGAQST